MLAHWVAGRTRLRVPGGRTILHARRTRMIAGTAYALLLVVALAAAVAAAAPSGLCGGCHAMRPYAVAHEESEHGSAGCATCHAPSPADRAGMVGRVFFRMLPKAITGAQEIIGPAQGVAADGCVSCHTADIEEMADRDGIRVLHPACASGSVCIDCHGAVAHSDAVRVSRAYTMESCTDCHQTGKATLECDACHSAHTQRERLEHGPWQVTHGAQWSQTHGLGNLRSCGVCHPPDYCVRCHGTVLPHPIGFGRSHGDEAAKNLSVCAACHDPDTLCTPCHGIEMPHPDGFLPEHSSIADGVEDPACVRCHDPEECVACHVRHVHPGNAAQPPKAGD